MYKAKYSIGLNDFFYCGSLHISHPSFDPATVTKRLDLQPIRTTQVGQPHRSVPDRKYDFSHWFYKLPASDDEDISTFLTKAVELLMPHQSYLEELSDDGATIECFIGVFAKRLCDQLYGHELLGSLAALRINLRFDVYSADDNEAGSPDIFPPQL